jgi:ribonuclease HI
MVSNAAAGGTVTFHHVFLRRFQRTATACLAVLGDRGETWMINITTRRHTTVLTGTTPPGGNINSVVLAALDTAIATLGTPRFRTGTLTVTTVVDGLLDIAPATIHPRRRKQVAALAEQVTAARQRWRTQGWNVETVKNSIEVQQLAYTYPNIEAAELAEQPAQPGTVRVACDGSYDPRSRHGAWCWHSSTGATEAGPVNVHDHGSLAAEIAAMTKALDAHRGTQITVVSDCRRVVAVARYIHTHRTIPGSAANSPLREQWTQLAEALLASDAAIYWVRGHATDLLHNHADRTARAAMRLERKLASV